MADGDSGKDQPSLELPKLWWRRTRRDAALEAPTQRLPPSSAPMPLAVEPVPAPEPVPEAADAGTERGPGGMLAAVLTGVAVGLGMVGLTWASLRLCESVRGTSSCGDAGYGLLFAIVVVIVVVGGLLLRVARVPEPGSTSFLAVGLTSVLALLFLVDSLLDRSMVVVIPLLSAGAFAAAHWLTRAVIEPAER